MGHHYLPQRLLQEFSEDGVGLWALDMTADGSEKLLPIKGIANEPRMNLPSVEKRLNLEVEIPFNNLLESLGSRITLDLQERQAIARYVMTMYRRVPRGRARSAAAVPNVAEVNERAALASIDELERLAPHERDLAEKGRANIKAIFRKIQSQDPTWLWQATLLPDVFSRVITLLSQMSWAYLRAPAERQLLIGDSPVLFDESRGLAHEGAELIFPIGSGAVLVATWRIGERWTRGKLRAQQVNAINAWSVRAAERWIYFRRNERWIEPMCKARSDVRDNPSIRQ
jgi:hypothetical protein